MSWIFDHIMTLGEKTAVSSGKIGFMDQAASTTAQYRSLLHFSHFYCFSIVTFSPFTIIDEYHGCRSCHSLLHQYPVDYSRSPQVLSSSKERTFSTTEIDCVFGYRVAVFIESDPHFSSASSEEHITNAELPTDR